VKRDELGRFAPTGGQATGPSSAEFTAAGQRRLEEMTEQFRTLVVASGTVNARKRGSQAADESDVDEAYRRMLSTRRRPLVVDLGAEIGLFIAGGLVSYGSTLLTGTPRLIGPGWTLLVLGIVTGIYSAILKHTDMS